MDVVKDSIACNAETSAFINQEPVGIRSANSAPRANRLAFLLVDLAGGGVQKNTLTLAKAFAAKGYPIDLLVCSDQGPLRCQVPEEINLVRLDSAPLLKSRFTALAAGNGYRASLLRPVLLARKPSRTLRNLPALADYLRTAQPAALLSATVHQNIEAVLAKQLSGVTTRVVATQSHHFSQWRKISGEWRRRHVVGLARRAYLAADEIIAVSQGVADDLADCLDLPAGRIKVIYNPVLTPALVEGMNEAPDHPWFKDGEPPVILCVGRPGRQKDMGTLLRAFAKVRQHSAARLLILGEAVDPGKKRRRQSELLRLAGQLGIESAVEFHGFVQNPYAYMANAAVFVLSSRYEGFGNVLAEALACGCPVVSTDCPSGPAEILQNGAFGTLVPVGDVQAMATAICATLEQPVDRSHLFRRASEFALDPIAQRYVKLLLGS